jgi:hypothetical protein
MGKASAGHEYCSRGGKWILEFLIFEDQDCQANETESRNESRPKRLAELPVGLMRPSNNLMVVVLPTPFGPRKPKMGCWATLIRSSALSAGPLAVGFGESLGVNNPIRG